MDKKEFDYYLPEKLIAQHPAEKRDGSRLLVLDKTTGQIQHESFRDIKKYLRKGDCLVINNTRVMPARLLGTRRGGTAPVEVLLLKRLSVDEWETIVRPGKKLREGDGAVFIENELECEVLTVKEDGNRIIRFYFSGIWEEVLEKAGHVPLPPYIHEQLSKEDRERYQTVYAKNPGSSAAPTAGLHFTKELLSDLSDSGVDIAEITLHVGLGTFRPVKADRIEDHRMHSEEYSIAEEAAEKINKAKNKGNRVIAVGTTSCRVLESCPLENGRVVPYSGDTDIFIYPGYKFKMVDAIITNFHLPQSTLIMLVSAFAGKENTMNAYKEAIEQGYRFYSFGDAMFISERNKR